MVKHELIWEPPFIEVLNNRLIGLCKTAFPDMITKQEWSTHRDIVDTVVYHSCGHTLSSSLVYVAGIMWCLWERGVTINTWSSVEIGDPQFEEKVMAIMIEHVKEFKYRRSYGLLSNGIK